MADRKRMLKAAVMAAPLSALAWAAHAAGPACDGDIVMAQASQDAGVPSTPHQEQVLRGKQGSEQQGAPEPSAGPSSSASQDAGVPSSPHQEQLLRGEQRGEQQGDPQLSTEQPQTDAQGSDMPSSPHQEQLLHGKQGGKQ